LRLACWGWTVLKTAERVLKFEIFRPGGAESPGRVLEIVEAHPGYCEALLDGEKPDDPKRRIITTLPYLVITEVSDEI
jgi:hypothetical protein